MRSDAYAHRHGAAGLAAVAFGWAVPAIAAAEPIPLELACPVFPARPLDAFSGPTGVALADFDGDGDLDVSIANSLSSVVFVYFNAGDGSFIDPFALRAPRQWEPNSRGVGSLFPLPLELFTGGSPVAVAAGQLNGDEWPDLVAADFDNGVVHVFLGPIAAPAALRGRGTPPISYPVAAGPVALAVGDVNGDGVPDIVSAAKSSNRVTILINNGAGGFGPPVNLICPGNPGAVALADLDGVNGPDIVAANSLGGDVSVFLNAGSGAFPARVDHEAGVEPTAVALGDIDGANGPDIVVADIGGGAVIILFNNGLGGIAGQAVIPDLGSPSAVALSDVDLSGEVDVLVTDADSASMTVLLRQPARGSGIVFENAAYAAGRAPRAIAVGDLDNNGRPDAAVANADDDNVSILRNTPDAGVRGGVAPWSLKAHATVETGVDPVAVVAHDFDGDGADDLATANQSENSVTLLRGLGHGRFDLPQAVATTLSPDRMVLGRLNEDSLTDIAVLSTLGASIRVLLSNGDGSFDSLPLVDVGLRPVDLIAADFTNDGIDDILIADELGGTLELFQTEADGMLNPVGAIPLPAPPEPKPVGLTALDFDADGRPDYIAIVETQADRLYFFPTFFLRGEAADGLPTGSRGGLPLSTILGFEPTTISNLGAVPAGSPLEAMLGPRLIDRGGPTSTAYLVGITGAPDGALLILIVSEDGVLTEFGPLTGVCFGSKFVVGADVGGDGFPDIFWSCPSNQAVFHLDLMSGFNFVFVEGEQTAAAFGDFEADGSPDIAVTNRGPDSVTVATNLGGPNPPWASLPGDAGAPAGSEVVLRAKAGGSPEVRYRWLRSGVQVFDDLDHYSGAATPTLVILSLRQEDVGVYSLRVSTPCGEQTFAGVTVFIAPPIGCTGDANGSGVVDFGDILAILANFGGPGPVGDADGNGVVDFSDILTVLANFGAICP